MKFKKSGSGNKRIVEFDELKKGDIFVQVSERNEKDPIVFYMLIELNKESFILNLEEGNLLKSNSIDAFSKNSFFKLKGKFIWR